MYDCLVCGVVVRLLQRVGWLQGKICRGWTLDFGNSKSWHAHYEIWVMSSNSRLRPMFELARSNFSGTNKGFGPY